MAGAGGEDGFADVDTFDTNTTLSNQESSALPSLVTNSRAKSTLFDESNSPDTPAAAPPTTILEWETSLEGTQSSEVPTLQTPRSRRSFPSHYSTPSSIAGDKPSSPLSHTYSTPSSGKRRSAQISTGDGDTLYSNRPSTTPQMDQSIESLDLTEDAGPPSPSPLPTAERQEQRRVHPMRRSNPLSILRGPRLSTRLTRNIAPAPQLLFKFPSADNRPPIPITVPRNTSPTTQPHFHVPSINRPPLTPLTPSTQPTATAPTPQTPVTNPRDSTPITPSSSQDEVVAALQDIQQLLLDTNRQHIQVIRDLAIKVNRLEEEAKRDRAHVDEVERNLTDGVDR
ncbi:uncharacterized protein LTR77_008380 [Saxophila tyrrhenica]|uniref:Uncharacterized protein n=1 Tax=Saxophila tyrrhenica TaxID=1690608 RepID=A0AAV9P0P4_9PEZI|nr:hypothetical protein LTR77_008380 [Saxophila tyrrhenica]